MNEKTERLSDEEEFLIASFETDPGPGEGAVAAATGLADGAALSPRAALAQDMKQLVALDDRISKLGEAKEAADHELELQAKDLIAEVVRCGDMVRTAKKDYADLKAEMVVAGLAIYEKTEDKDPALGVKITMNKSRILTVDKQVAVHWAVENKHETLLLLFEDKYADLLETGVMDNMPGEVDSSTRPGCRISLKPYQGEK